jgi:hypothetical protein
MVIDHPISKTARILVEACSFAGTGNVLKIQAVLHCDDHIRLTASKKDTEEEKRMQRRRRRSTYGMFFNIVYYFSTTTTLQMECHYLH